MKCGIRWIFVHGYLMTLFAEIAEVQKNNPPPPKLYLTFFLEATEMGF